MRVKKQKKHRKVVRFYSACFGFREPYKVLCDGTFIHHLLLYNLTPADDCLSHLLGARVVIFSTRCIIAELKSLGESHTNALIAANQLFTARCDHEKRVSAAACIESIIKDSNAEHFFLATQDSDIRKMFRQVPGVPVIYGLRNSLFLEQPSCNQREFIKSTEEKRLHMNESEYQNLYRREQKDKLNSGGKNDIANDVLPRTNIKMAKRTFGVVDKVRFKRKGAKGPNPLSCKKKKQKEDTSASKNQDIEAGNIHKRKRNRKRKRDQMEESKLE
ncbi:hypothetical protein AXF42_Ash007037 [Apostasia shenzhenica]|uniref:UTP23 sensor motif region domain-containing protein n=1 Tax=Apostasia shenzhenica TaxID=1088818 RepID=A0A2I0BEV9_9ASPA|nr:hypothetical protein AXF42_Ash007037 [Apostasia shenzhenica]